MYPTSMGKQVLAMQRNMFNQTMDSFFSFLDQNAKITDAWKLTTVIPEQAVKSTAGWSRAIKQNLRAYSNLVNSGFDNMEAFFSVPSRMWFDRDEPL